MIIFIQNDLALAKYKQFERIENDYFVLLGIVYFNIKL